VNGENYTMRSFIICTPCLMLQGEQIMRREIGGTCRPNRRHKHVKMWSGNLGENTSADGTIILK
jgi:hypothetical protein